MSDTEVSDLTQNIDSESLAGSGFADLQYGPSGRPRLPRRVVRALRRRLGITLLVLAALIAAGVYYGYRISAKTSSFVEGVAQTGTVRQAVAISGTIEPTTQSDLYFASSGTVSTINVAAGQVVKSGQLLATLDNTTANNQINQAQSALTTAQANLASAEAALPVGNAVNSQGLTQTQLSVSQDQAQLALDQATYTQDQAIVANFCQAGPSSTECQTAQQNLIAAQSTVSHDNQLIAQDQLGLTATENKNQQSADQAAASVTSAQDQLSSAEAACSGTCTTQQDAAIASAQAQLSSAEVSQTDTLASNQTSLAQSQLNLSQAQSTLASDQATEQLDSAIATGGCSVDPSSTECVSAQAALTQQAQTDTAAQNTLANAQTQVSSTQDKNSQSLQQSQSQITLDKLQVASDQQTLATDQALISQYQITAPTDGTVEAVSLTVGSPSSGGFITFKSSSTWVVDATVSDTQISSINVGQQALVTPSTATAPLFGTVTSVADTATVTSGVASFAVVVSISQTQLGANGQIINASGLFAGASASVEVITKSVSGVLTIPTSAIHTVGSRSIVFVPSGTKEKPVVVTIGATGVPLTQITSGLKAGETVIIANRAIAAATTAGPVRGLFGGGGGFGGGGFGGGRARAGGGARAGG